MVNIQCVRIENRFLKRSSKMSNLMYFQCVRIENRFLWRSFDGPEMCGGGSIFNADELI